MSYSILASGYRPTFTHFTFDSSKATIKINADSKAPENASWIESSKNGIIYATSEVPDGKVYSLKLREGEVEITSDATTTGEDPAHICVLRDGSGIIVGNAQGGFGISTNHRLMTSTYIQYSGGQILFIPTNPDGTLASQTPKPLVFDFPYNGKGPNAERQEKPHAHQILEAGDGKLYVCDLGSDRVWVVERQGDVEMKVVGWLQCNEGAGPRHALFSPDELHHSILVFSLDKSSYPSHPLPNTEQSVLPPDVPSTHTKYMDSAEIVLHPDNPTTIYASNRWQLHVQEHNKGANLSELPEVPGDAVAIVSLTAKGDGIESIKHVRTGCDGIRGMQISKDGKYVVIAGQKGGGVEIYKIGGERGEEWKLAAKEEKLEQVVDFVWL